MVHSREVEVLDARAGGGWGGGPALASKVGEVFVGLGRGLGEEGDGEGAGGVECRADELGARVRTDSTIPVELPCSVK